LYAAWTALICPRIKLLAGARQVGAVEKYIAIEA